MIIRGVYYNKITQSNAQKQNTKSTGVLSKFRIRPRWCIPSLAKWIASKLALCRTYPKQTWRSLAIFKTMSQTLTSVKGAFVWLEAHLKAESKSPSTKMCWRFGLPASQSLIDQLYRLNCCPLDPRKIKIVWPSLVVGFDRRNHLQEITQALKFTRKHHNSILEVIIIIEGSPNNEGSIYL